MTAKGKTFPVYGQKLAGYLMYNGFVLAGIAPDNRPQIGRKNKNVFFFWESPTINRAIKDYKNGHIIR